MDSEIAKISRRRRMHDDLLVCLYRLVEGEAQKSLPETDVVAKTMGVSESDVDIAWSKLSKEKYISGIGVWSVGEDHTSGFSSSWLTQEGIEAAEDVILRRNSGEDACLRYLEALGQMVEYKPGRTVERYAPASSIGMSADDCMAVVRHLIHENLVVEPGVSGATQLTIAGVRVLTEGRLPPDSYKQGLQLNTNISNGAGGQVSVVTGSHNAVVQSRSMEVSDLISLVDKFEKHIERENIPEDERAHVLSQIQAIKEQGQKPQPSRKMLAAAVKSIVTVVEGTLSQAGASMLTQMMGFVS